MEQRRIQKLIQGEILKCPLLWDICIWGSVLFFTVLYISLIFNHNIWTDEAFTLQLLKGNVAEIISGTAKDVHPPLYYLYAKLFTVFGGNSLLVQKIAVVIPMAATLIIGATVVRRHFGDRTSLLFLLFLSCIPCSMEFAVQVRMYSLALLFVTLCGLYAYLAFLQGRKQEFAVFAISGTAAAYTHYFAFVSVLVIAGLLLLAILIWNRKRLTGFLAAGAGMLLCYLPWFPSMFRQVVSVEAGYWISEITADTICSYFIWTFGVAVFPAAVFIFLIILKGTAVYNIVKITSQRKAEDIYALLCMMVPMLTMLLGVVLSVWKTPIYRDQYIFPALGMLSLFFGITMRNAKPLILAAVSAFLLMMGALQYRECFLQEYRSTLVPQTEAFFDENLSENDFIVYNWEAYGFIYECYFPAEQLVYLEEFDFSGDFETVWFMDSEWMPEVDGTILEANGLVIEYVGHYGVEHNEFDMYKIYRP